jgi:hypothetical protein
MAEASSSPDQGAVNRYVGENSAAFDRLGPNLKQRVTVIDSSQRETLCARNYAGEGQAA